jgi:hypothetical protein
MNCLRQWIRKETRPPNLIKPPKRTYQDGVANLAGTDSGA